MPIVAKFHKVSFEQFQSDWERFFPGSGSIVEDIYNNIQLPKRGTSGSAGYDFFAPAPFFVQHSNCITIPTGIRCEFFDPSWFLNIVVRSGQGFKSGIHLANTCGIIDSDYFNADNEGHILIKLVHDSCVGKDSMFEVEQGKGFAQGIFMLYGMAEGDNVSAERTGGFGSTSNS